MIFLIFIMCVFFFFLGIFLLGFNSSLEGVELSIQMKHSTGTVQYEYHPGAKSDRKKKYHDSTI